MNRILLVGLGPLGQFVANDAAKRGVARVVAAVDIDPAVVGKPLSAIVPECGFGTKVLRSIDDVQNWGEIDCAVVTTSSDLAACMGTFRELLLRDVSIVSTCEELLFPWLRHKSLADELHALAVEHGARIMGTGVNPGFIMDALPVATTAVSKSVRSVKCWRIQDATTRRIPFQKKIGATLDDAGFAARVKDGSLRHVGLGESLHFISHYLGLGVVKWDETIAPVKAERDMTCGLGPIRRGDAAGVRQTAHGWNAAGEEVVTMEFQAAIGQTGPHDRVVIEGEPRIDLRIEGGIHGDVATSAITLNAIDSLLESKPGLHTMATVPMVRCAAAK
jgi:4-hydroxy-tetrahydrodipicolinate reductase